jgi:Calcineurin-like phosphoesterase
MRIRARPLVALLLLAPATQAGAQQNRFTGVERIVAVGDVHGDYMQFVTVLRQTGIIDDRNHWTGGKTHLVQNGDLLDRGADSRKVMDLLMALEKEAPKAGGMVHALIGNHEAMNILGDLRYTSPGEFEAFRSRGSEALRDRAYKILSDSARRDDDAYHRQWNDDHPLGWVEQRLAFEGTGSYGDWIRGHNAVIAIDGYLFLHGGISSKYLSASLDALNDSVRANLKAGRPAEPRGVAEDPDGPLWYRGLAQGDEAELAPLVDSVLAAFGVEHVVIGHTVTPGTVIPRFDGKVIMIDVGMSAVYGGPPAALLIEHGVPSTIHRGTRLELPLGGDLLPYLEAAAALDPAPTRLQKLIDQLKTAAVPSR